MMQVYCWYSDVCFCLTCIQAEKADKKQSFNSRTGHPSYPTAILAKQHCCAESHQR